MIEAKGRLIIPGMSDVLFLTGGNGKGISQTWGIFQHVGKFYLGEKFKDETVTGFNSYAVQMTSCQTITVDLTIWYQPDTVKVCFCILHCYQCTL